MTGGEVNRRLLREKNSLKKKKKVPTAIKLDGGGDDKAFRI